MNRSFEWLKRRYELFVKYIGKELNKLKITLDVKVSLLVYKHTFFCSTMGGYKLGARAEVLLRVLGVLLRSVVLLTVIIFLMAIEPVCAKPNDEPLKRLVLTLLAPKIQEQINHYYKNKLTVSPKFTPFLDGTNVDVKYHSSHIDVQVKTIPYVGPHLDVGLDSMRFSIYNSGSVVVLDYQHIRDYDLPPNWQEIIKTR